MKNKMIKLIFLFMLAGSIFVGCGGNETGADANNGSGTNTNTEVDVKEDGENTNDEIDMSIYTEFSWCYGIIDEAKRDYSLADGELMQEADWDDVGQIIKLTGTVDFYSGEKVKGGFLKSGIECTYPKVNGDWSVLHIDMDGTKGITYVRTDELIANMEVIGTVSDTEENTVMSAEAEAILEMFKERVAENNIVREEAQKQYPNMTILPLEEADSPEGLECFGTFHCHLEDEDGMEGLLTAFLMQDYNKYYIEYVGESNIGVEINIYGAK